MPFLYDDGLLCRVGITNGLVSSLRCLCWTLDTWRFDTTNEYNLIWNSLIDNNQFNFDLFMN